VNQKKKRRITAFMSFDSVMVLYCEDFVTWVVDSIGWWYRMDCWIKVASMMMIGGSLIRFEKWKPSQWTRRAHRKKKEEWMVPHMVSGHQKEDDSLSISSSAAACTRNDKKRKRCSPSSDNFQGMRLSTSPSPAGSLNVKKLSQLMTFKRLKPKKKKTVFIWDLDETLILLASLYDGRFAQANQKDPSTGKLLGEGMMQFLLQALDTSFFFKDLHTTEIHHVSMVDNLPDHQQKEQKKKIHTKEKTCNDMDAASSMVCTKTLELKNRFRQIRAIYEQKPKIALTANKKMNLIPFLDENHVMYTIREDLFASIEHYSNGWTTLAIQVLEAVRLRGTRRKEKEEKKQEEQEEEEAINVMVTNSQLVPAFCKCLVYKLDRFFPLDMIYSSTKVHKYQCFQQIMDRFLQDQKEEQEEVKFIAIGDGLEEEQVSAALGMDFFKIQNRHDLARLKELIEKKQTL
jgi:EYA(Eyes Absent) family protein